MLGVIEAAFDRWPPFDLGVPALDHLLWKMQPPGDLPVRHTVGVIDGQIMATALRWMAEAEVDGQILIVNDGANIAIDPAYQGRGFSRMMNQSEIRRDQLGHLGVSTRSHNERVLKIRVQGGRAERYLRVWSRAFDLRTALATHLRAGGPLHLARVLPRLLARRRSAPSLAAGVWLEVITQFDERADALWEATRGTFDLARVRRAPYLNWRYADPRAGETLILGAFDGASSTHAALLAYAVFRRTGDHWNLIDVFTHPGHGHATAPLVAEGCTRLRELGCRAITAWLPPGHPDAPALRAAGFEDTGRPLLLEFDAPPGQTADPERLARFAAPDLRVHVTMGDFDFA